jgi:arsenate reductase
MAEAILGHLAGDRFDAMSAGTQPAGFIHPLAIEAMRRMDVPVESQRSKSWDEFAETPLDVVITVCDAAAGQKCPVWFGSPITAHWSVPDPAGHLGGEEERLEFALRVAERLRVKIVAFSDLDWSMSREALTERLRFLGEI